MQSHRTAMRFPWARLCLMLTTWLILAVSLSTPAKSEEIELLDVTAATATQTTASFRLAKKVETILVTLDVTAGTTLLIDFDLEIFVPGIAGWTPLHFDMPSTQGVTGISTTHAVYGDPVLDVAITDKRLPLGGLMRFVVRHGNANAATYKLFMQKLLN